MRLLCSVYGMEQVYSPIVMSHDFGLKAGKVGGGGGGGVLHTVLGGAGTVNKTAVIWRGG
jgi:hypothetical protein